MASGRPGAAVVGELGWPATLVEVRRLQLSLFGRLSAAGGTDGGRTWQVGCLTMLSMYQGPRLRMSRCTYSPVAICCLLIVGCCREQGGPIAVEAVGGSTSLGGGSIGTIPPRDCNCPFPRVLTGISTASCLRFASTWRQACATCYLRMDIGPMWPPSIPRWA